MADRKVMQTRIITGLIFGSVMIGGLIAGMTVTTVLLTMIGAGCLYEYVKMVKGNDIRFFVLPALSIIGCIYFFYENKIDTGILRFLFLLQSVFLVIMATHLWKPMMNHKKAFALISILYIVLPVFLTIISVFEKGSGSYLLYLFLLIWTSDSSAYFVGSRFGKKKLFPSISPNKTWEGFLGAGLFTIITGCVISLVTQEASLTAWILVSVWVWVMGSIGDLFESSIKRTFGVKDSGQILPGHGGFLDRFDSFLFVTAFGSWILVWL